MKLLLIRHGQTPSNVRKALDTALPGPPLTELGQEQARALVEKLADEPIVAVYASRATRAQQTATPLAESKDLPVQVIDGVHEVSVGDLEGNSDPESIETYLTTVGPWLRGELSGAMPGGESGAQVRDRYVAAVTELRAKHQETDPDGVVVLVSHGGVIRLGADWLADNVRADVADATLLPNTAIVELDALEDGGWTCRNWAGVSLAD